MPFRTFFPSPPASGAFTPNTGTVGSNLLSSSTANLYDTRLSYAAGTTTTVFSTTVSVTKRSIIIAGAVIINASGIGWVLIEIDGPLLSAGINSDAPTHAVTSRIVDAGSHTVTYKIQASTTSGIILFGFSRSAGTTGLSVPPMHVYYDIVELE